MKLATIDNGSPDGALAVVSQDLSRAVFAGNLAKTLQDALDRWDAAEPDLRRLAEALETGAVNDVFNFDPTAAKSPLPRPRQWLDASAFPNHARLMAFGLEPNFPEFPLMYQGFSDHTLAPTEHALFRSEVDGIDFEGEFAVVLDDVPMGTNEAVARDHIRLVMLANDWSLRAFGPAEMRTGFGFIRAKPATAFGPVAVTPDELGAAWRDARVGLDLSVHRGEQHFGRPNGTEMAFGFDQLVAHAAYNRRLSAGTIIGSGTVSNAAFAEVGSTCIAEQRSIETIANGEPTTPFLAFGERVRLEAFGADGVSMFGAIEQIVTKGG